MAHVNFEQSKMNVKLAAQALSNSVGTAIEHCEVGLRMPEFEGSKGTVKFIKTIDHLFDILNSRNPCAKATLRLDNQESWAPFLEEAYDYIRHLKNPAGKFMFKTQAKTGFIGFMVAIRSVEGIFEDLVGGLGSPLRYILTYKFSQDHLELWFGAVRYSGGCNNNPTVRQFVAAYKRLLLRSSIAGGRGNCLKLDNTNILYIMDDIYKTGKEEFRLSDVALARKYGIDEKRPMTSDHDYADTANFSVNILSDFKKTAVTYIAGSAARITTRSLWCKECCEALGSTNHEPHSEFLRKIDRGGLFKPSLSVIRICQETEIRFQRMLHCTSGNMPRGQGKTFILLQDQLSSG